MKCSVLIFKTTTATLLQKLTCTNINTHAAVFSIRDNGYKVNLLSILHDELKSLFH